MKNQSKENITIHVVYHIMLTLKFDIKNVLLL